MMLHLLAEDPSKPLGQSAPTLSQTTLQILQSQASTSAVEKPEDSPTIDKKKDSKKVTGGLFKEWFSRARVSKTAEPPGVTSSPLPQKKAPPLGMV